MGFYTQKCIQEMQARNYHILNFKSYQIGNFVVTSNQTHKKHLFNNIKNIK